MSNTTTATYRQVCGPGYLIIGAAGLFCTTIAVAAWALVLSLLSPFNAAPMLALAAAVGLGLGLALAVLRPTAAYTPFTGAALGLVAAIAWLLLSGFRPLGQPEASLGGFLSPVIALTLAGFGAQQMTRSLDLRTIRRDHVEHLAIRILTGLGLFFFIGIVVFPFLFMVSSSLKPRAEFLQNPTNLSVNLLQDPARLLNGYIEVLTRFSFARFILNSAVVSVATMVVTLIPAILGAYAVTRLQFPGRNVLSKSILLIYMFPAIVLVIPLYSVFTQLGLRDTRHGLLFVYAAMTIPVALYMLRSYFQTLPRDLEEAGLIDGLSRFGVILRITLPLSVPAIASVGLYVFMIAWNEFLFAFMFLDSPPVFTLSRGMVMLNDQEVPRQFLMAGAVIITVPIMLLFFKFQKLLTGGLTAGGVKG